MAGSKIVALVQAWAHGLSGRERILFLVVLVTTLTFVADTWVFASQKNKTQVLQTQWIAQRAKLNASAHTPASTPSHGGDEILAARSAELNAIREDLAYAKALIEAAQRDAHVGAMARTLIAQSRGVTLRGLQTRPAQPFFKPQAHAAQTKVNPLPQLYLHAVEISVDGPYADIVRFLQRLESHDQPLFWPVATVSVTTPGFVNLRATVQMLSVRPDAPLQ